MNKMAMNGNKCKITGRCLSANKSVVCNLPASCTKRMKRGGQEPLQLSKKPFNCFSSTEFKYLHFKGLIDDSANHLHEIMDAKEWGEIYGVTFLSMLCRVVEKNYFFILIADLWVSKCKALDISTCTYFIGRACLGIFS